MLISAEKLVTWEICPRRFAWTNRYHSRISLMGATYRALDAGLRATGDPARAAENELLAMAANPGLDVVGVDTYAIAMHFARLSAILALTLRNAFKAPWSAWPDVEASWEVLHLHGWRSACYDAGDGIPRRIALVDRWSDDRKLSEMRSWRSIGEACALRKPISLTAIAIGASHDKRRISPWTRCFRHPRGNRTYRFRRLSSKEDFSANWEPVWRENTDIPTEAWLAKMQKDGCMDAVQTVIVPVPPRREAYVKEMARIADEIAKWEERGADNPPMRLAGCADPLHGACVFSNICHGSAPPIPEKYGFRARIPLHPQT